MSREQELLGAQEIEICKPYSGLWLFLCSLCAHMQYQGGPDHAIMDVVRMMMIRDVTTQQAHPSPYIPVGWHSYK
jgi:hypothetical protein